MPNLVVIAAELSPSDVIRHDGKVVEVPPEEIEV
jgi:hypothetical protein